LERFNHVRSDERTIYILLREKRFLFKKFVDKVDKKHRRNIYVFKQKLKWQKIFLYCILSKEKYRKMTRWIKLII